LIVSYVLWLKINLCVKCKEIPLLAASLREFSAAGAFSINTAALAV